MNVDEIIKLMQAVSDNGLTSLELKEGELKLSLKREKEMPQIVTVSAPSPDAPSMQMAAMQNGLAAPSMMSPAMMPQGVMMPQAAQDTAGRADIGSDKVVTSPLVGTFYNASSPDAAPFVQAGDTVKKGQVLGIIEAMKLMNEIESEYDGIVEEILVKNEETVEYGQPLFRIR